MTKTLPGTAAAAAATAAESSTTKGGSGLPRKRPYPAEPGGLDDSEERPLKEVRRTVDQVAPRGAESAAATTSKPRSDAVAPKPRVGVGDKAGDKRSPRPATAEGKTSTSVPRRTTDPVETGSSNGSAKASPARSGGAKARPDKKRAGEVNGGAAAAAPFKKDRLIAAASSPAVNGSGSGSGSGPGSTTSASALSTTGATAAPLRGAQVFHSLREIEQRRRRLAAEAEAAARAAVRAAQRASEVRARAEQELRAAAAAEEAAVQALRQASRGAHNDTTSTANGNGDDGDDERKKEKGEDSRPVADWPLVGAEASEDELVRVLTTEHDAYAAFWQRLSSAAAAPEGHARATLLRWHRRLANAQRRLFERSLA